MTVQEYMFKIQEMMYPGQPEDVIVYFDKDKCYYNGELVEKSEGVTKAYDALIHQAVTCSGFTNGSWLSKVTYNTINDIQKQTEEDYEIDIEMMNFLYSLKVALNESYKGESFLLQYSYECGVSWIQGEEDIKEFLEQAEVDLAD